MDGENIPGEEIAAAVALGASVIEHLSTVSGIAVVWSVADGVLSCYDCFPMMGCLASFSNFKLGC